MKNKEIRLELWVTEDEKALLKTKAYAAGKSMSAILRSAIKDELVHVAITSEQWAFIDAISKHCADLARLGNLLNQLLAIIETTNEDTQAILRHFNLNDVEEIKNLIADLRKNKNHLYEVKLP